MSNAINPAVLQQRLVEQSKLCRAKNENHTANLLDDAVICIRDLDCRMRELATLAQHMGIKS